MDPQSPTCGDEKMTNATDSDEGMQPNKIIDIKKEISQIYIREKKAGNKVNPETMIYPILEEALKTDPLNVELWMEYMVTMERNKEPLNKIVGVVERSLSNKFEKAEHYRLLWFAYIDCQRRHTNWEDQKEVESLDKSIDRCDQHLSRIPESDPELSLLKYWALIQAKYLKNMDEARKTWDSITKQGLEYSKTAKFWLEFAEFERLFGKDDTEQYRKLLYRALQQTNDYPEIIGERLIKFERQEGDTVEKVVEAQQRINQALVKLSVVRKRTEEIEAQKRPKKKRKRKNQQEKLGQDNDTTGRARKRPYDCNQPQSDTLIEESKSRKISKSVQESDEESVPSEPKRIKELFIPRALLGKKKA